MGAIGPTILPTCGLVGVAIASLILMIIASLAANRGEWYRYPVTIRFIT